MKKGYSQVSNKQLLLWIIIPIISLIVNVFVSKIQDENGLFCSIVSLAYLGLLILIVYSFYNFCVTKILNNALQTQLYLEISKISEEIIKRTKNKDDLHSSSKNNIGIIPEHELAKFEKNGDFKEIWVISHDLSAELNSYLDIVPYNLNRGIKYKFFYQNTPQNDMRIKQLKIKNNHSTNAEYYKLKDEFFFIVTNLDFTIYNPFSFAEEGRVGYIGLEFPETTELYALKVNDDLVDSISSILLKNYLSGE